METFIVNTQPFPREEVLDLRKLYGENKLNRTVMSEVSEHNISADLAFGRFWLCHKAVCNKSKLNRLVLHVHNLLI